MIACIIFAAILAGLFMGACLAWFVGIISKDEDDPFTTYTTYLKALKSKQVLDANFEYFSVVYELGGIDDCYFLTPIGVLLYWFTTVAHLIKGKFINIKMLKL